MTREEAYEALKEGNKITHHYFGRNEYYEMKDNSIIAEDGVNHSRVFWQQDQDNWRADGWELYIENNP